MVWNLGSLLGFFVAIQVVTGLLLVLNYTSNEGAFDSVQYLMIERNYGYFVRILHFNGAASIFIVLYLHLFKGLYHGSYRLSKVWRTGVLLLVLIIATAFSGYVLLYSQMRYWAAIVIINFFSTIPILGNNLVLLIFGRFIVRRRTLKLLFVVHFLVPFLILLMILVHFYFLHEYGSSSSLSLVNDDAKIYFYPSYAMKDSINLSFILISWILILIYPFYLGDPEMFIEKDQMSRPVHIIPEFYFLFAYAILRAIPNKRLGLTLLVLAIVSLFLLSINGDYMYKLPGSLLRWHKILIFSFIRIGLVLTFLGKALVEVPFITLSLLFTVLYFLTLSLILFIRWAFNLSLR